MLPIGKVQIDQKTIFPFNPLLFISKNRHISITEAVNRLAHVANHEETAALTSEGIDNIPLALVRVLVLIYHHGVQFLLPTLADIFTLEELLSRVF